MPVSQKHKLFFSILRVSKSISVFKEKNTLFHMTFPKFFFFDCHNSKGIKLITRLRVGLNHSRVHKFKHSFQDTINHLRNCGQDMESTTQFFLHCLFFINKRRTLLSLIRSLDSKLLDSTDYDLTQTLLFDNTSQTLSINFQIINASTFLNKFFHQIISKSEFNQQFFFFCNCQFSVVHIYLLLLLVILYSQVLFDILVFGDRVILFT